MLCACNIREKEMLSLNEILLLLKKHFQINYLKGNLTISLHIIRIQNLFKLIQILRLNLVKDINITANITAIRREFSSNNSEIGNK